MKIAQRFKRNSAIIAGLIFVNIIVVSYLVLLMARDVKQLADVEMPLEQAILEMEINAGETAQAVLDYIWDREERDIDKMHDSESDFEHYAKQFIRLAETVEERKLGREVIMIYQEFKTLGDEIVTIAKLQSEKLQLLHRDFNIIDALIDEKLQPAIDRDGPEALTKLEAALDMEINIAEAFAAIEGYILAPNPQLKVKIADSEADFKRFEAQYSGTRMSATEKRWVSEIDIAFSEAVTAGNEIVMLTDALHEKLENYEEDLYTIDNILDDQIQPLIFQETKLAAWEAEIAGRVTLFATIGFGLLAVAISFLFSRRMHLGIVGAIDSLTDGTEAFGKGDLDYHIEVEREDELGDLATAFNAMAKRRRRAEEEKTKLEEQVRRTQRLETIGTMAGGIAHDFNNILSPILGYSDMVMSELQPSDPMYQDMEEIMKAGYRAKDMVEQILLFSKQVEKERIPIELHLIVQEALKLLRPSIPATIEIRLQMNATSDMVVLADATQMHQVIVNLCTNAWHAMEAQGGLLSIEMKRVDVDPEIAKLHPNLNEAEYVRLSIIDTGTGMNKETIDRIFEPFFTTKPVDKGTGMGLSVVHGIVQSHHGAILVDSEPGKGSAFHVYLPVAKAQMETEEIEPAAIVGGQESILVVDDDDANLNMIRKMLQGLGYESDVYDNSSDALNAFRQQPDKYDLLISDFTMPKMTGVHLAEQLQHLRSGFPVLIMTGYSERNLKDAVMNQFGSIPFIMKPLVRKEQAAAIREVLSNASTIQHQASSIPPP